MPTDIKLKNSVTATNAPTSLQQGEVAINITDKKVWVGNAATTPVLLLGSGADGTFTNLTVSGVASFADGTVSLPSITNIGDTNTGIFFPAADTIAFTEGGVESMRIDSSANVGIGTSSPNRALTIYRTSSPVLQLIDATTGTTSNDGLLIQQVGVDTYIENAEIGFMQFRTSATERMRIDSSGNVAIGMTPSTDTLLEVYGSASATCYKNVNTGTGTSDGFYVGMGKSSSTDAYVYNRENAPVIFGTNNAERMRIDSSGNVGIGTSSPSYKLEVIGATRIGPSGVDTYIGFGANSDNYFTAGSSGVQIFRNLGTERMRIDSSGNLLVGTTSTGTFGTNIAARVRSPSIGGSGGFGIGSAQLVSTAVVNTGLPINQESGGGTVLMIASRHTDAGTNTASAVYMIQFYYDGNNAPNPVLVSGSNFITFGVSGGNLTVQNSAGGNAYVSWFTNK